MLQSHDVNTNVDVSIVTHLRNAASQRDWVRRLCEMYPSAEVVCVVAGSAATIGLDDLALTPGRVRSIAIDDVLGKGAAMRIGGRIARGDIIIFADSEPDVALTAIGDVAAYLSATPACDGCIVRRTIGSSRKSDIRRLAASAVLARAARLLFGLKQSDPQAPVKGFRRSAFRRLFDDLMLYGRGFDVELMYRARKLGMRIEEIPVPRKPVVESWPLVRTGASVVAALLWLRVSESPLRRIIPGMSLIGRRFAIPYKRSYSILVFCWRDAEHPMAGGSEEYMLQQAAAWARQGHAVTWISQRFSGAAQDEVRNGIRFVRLSRFPWIFPAAILWYVFRSDKRYDFIIDCMNGIPFWSPMFSTKPKVCLVHHVHSHHFRDELPWPINHLAIAVETKLAPYVYRNVPFLTVSESSRSEMEALGISRRPIGVIHNGVGNDLKPGTKSHAPMVLYLGRLKRYKRVEKAIDAFIGLRQVYPEATLVIAGTGDHEDALREYAKQRGDHGVEFTGRVSEEEKLRLMQRAWVFVMPSSIEGWGIVVMEAAACGTPTVAYDVPGLCDCIENGTTGVLASDDREFAAALVRLVADDQTRTLMSENAYRRSRNYAWDKTAEKTMEVIRLMQPWQAVLEPSNAFDDLIMTMRNGSASTSIMQAETRH